MTRSSSPSATASGYRSALTLLTGGARSGKSTLALRLAQRFEAASGAPVGFVATCPRIPGDEELDARIDAHRLERPANWATIEAETDLVDALDRLTGEQGAEAVVIIDCLTLWVSNLLFRGASSEEIDQRSTETLQALAQRSGPTIAVTNEVGLGIVPADPETRRYRDVLGVVNQSWVTAADRSLFLVAGRAFDLHDPMSLLD